ncbi:probable transcription factor At1g61730 [Fagus crenata]
MSEESNTSPSPIQDMTQEKEKEAQNLQEPPQPQEQKREEQKKEEEHKVASPLSTSDEITVSNDTSTPLTSEEGENLQEPPQPQEQKEEEEEHKVASPLSTSDDTTVSTDTSTPLTSEEEEENSSTAASHVGGEMASSTEDEDVDVDIISLSSPCVRPARRPVQDSHKIDDDYDSPSQAKKKEIDDNDSHSQGKEKKIKTEPTQDDTPSPFLERVFTDIECEIGFLNSIIDFEKKHNRYPFFDYNAVIVFIKDWLQVEATSRQMTDAIVKLRKKYIDTKLKMGVHENFSDSRDQTAFNLAHEIWSSVTEEDWTILKLGIIAPAHRDEQAGRGGDSPGCS